MVDNSDTVYHLKRAVSGSGILLSNDDGVSIHFKNSLPLEFPDEALYSELFSVVL